MKKSYTTENGRLTIHIEETDDTVIMKWSGRSTSLYPAEFLNPIFDKILAANKKIIMNFNRVDFVTSSTLTPIIKLLEKIKEGTWQIEMQYDSSIEWQALTFSALGVFADCDRIHINGL